MEEIGQDREGLEKRGQKEVDREENLGEFSQRLGLVWLWLISWVYGEGSGETEGRGMAVGERGVVLKLALTGVRL
jgi:hypothetical protein